MLRTREQFELANERLDTIGNRIAALEKMAGDCSHSRAMLRLERTEQSKLRLLVHVAELRELQEKSCNAIPAWDLWDGSDAVGSALWFIRSLSGLSQADVATALETSQSAIARDERDCGASPKWPVAVRAGQRIGRLYKHAAVLDYEFVPVFVRKSGFGRPSSVSRLAIEAVTTRHFFGNASSEQALHAFLARTCDVLEAHSVSCYTAHPDSRALELSCVVGNQSAALVRTLASGKDIPSLLLNEKPCLVRPREHPILALSSFADEEGVQLTYVLPFNHLENPSILFINWCRDMGSYSQEFERSLSELANLISLAIGQERMPISRSSSNDDLSSMVKGILDSLLHKLTIPRCAITYHRFWRGQLVLDNGSPFVPDDAGEARSLLVERREDVRGVTVAAYLDREPIYIPDLKSSPNAARYVKLSRNLEFADMRTEFAVPVSSRSDRSRCYGVLNIEAPGVDALDGEAKKCVSECVDRLSLLFDYSGINRPDDEGDEFPRRDSLSGED